MKIMQDSFYGFQELEKKISKTPLQIYKKTFKKMKNGKIFVFKKCNNKTKRRKNENNCKRSKRNIKKKIFST